MSIDLVIAAALAFVAGAVACWFAGPRVLQPTKPDHVSLSKAARILNQLAAELEGKGLARIDRDGHGQVSRVRWAGENGVGIVGEGSHLSHSSSREPDADQGPQF